MDLNKAELPRQTWYGKVYYLFQTLSLDVAAGSLGGGLMAASLAGQKMPWAWHLLLPLSVWLIYTLDHLMDARRLGANAHTFRHLFHFRNFRLLAGIWIVLALTALVLGGFFLWPDGFWFGIILGALTGIHLLLVMLAGDRAAPWLTKELGVAVVYTVGIWGLPWWGTAGDAPWLIPMAGQFFLLSLVNLLEFSLFEFEIDEQDGHTSFVRGIGRNRARQLIYVLLGLTILVGLIVVAIWPYQLILYGEMIFLAMGTGLGLILTREPFFAVQERYRALGDAVFLLPYLVPAYLLSNF